MNVPGAPLPVPVPVAYLDRLPDDNEALLFEGYPANSLEAQAWIITGLPLPVWHTAANKVLRSILGWRDLAVDLTTGP